MLFVEEDTLIFLPRRIRNSIIKTWGLEENRKGPAWIVIVGQSSDAIWAQNIRPLRERS
jgi:hypothetical protein